MVSASFTPQQTSVATKSEKWPKSMFNTPSQCLIILLSILIACVYNLIILCGRGRKMLFYDKSAALLHYLCQPHLGCWIIKARVANFQQPHLAPTTLGIVPIRLQPSLQSRTHICCGSLLGRRREVHAAAQSFIKFLFVPSTKATCARGEILSRSIKKMSRRRN
jgi:hypothetical protein